MANIATAERRLNATAHIEIEAEFMAVATIEDLREADRNASEKAIYTGHGLCAKCRWMSCCLSCDREKAWNYACRMTLWATADEGLKPKAKPKARPNAMTRREAGQRPDASAWGWAS